MTFKDRVLDIREDPFSQSSMYRWFNIEQNGVRVGKVRMRCNQAEAVIYSIIIFPDYEGQGIAGRLVRVLKNSFRSIRADRVRHSARGFWLRMEFRPVQDGHYEWRLHCSQKNL